MDDDIIETRREHHDLTRTCNHLRDEIARLHTRERRLLAEIRELEARIAGLRLAQAHLTNTSKEQQQ